MRRSICISEPSIILAGESGTWKFSYVTSNNLPSGTLMRFDVLSDNAETSWESPQANPRNKKNFIWLTLPNGKSINAKPVEKSGSQFFEFALPTSINQGEKVTIHMGSPSDDHKEGGNRSQSFTQRRRAFHLYIDTKGKGDFAKDPEVFTLDVKGNSLKNIRVIAPSFVFKNNRFDVFIRFEDSFGNLTGNAPEGTLIELSYDQLRENLNWKLFVPETGFLTLPNLYFNEAGLYHLKLKNLTTGEEYQSSPIMCFLEDGDQLFWGQLHAESKRFDAVQNIESALRNIRDDEAMQFFSTSPFEQIEETSNDDWKLISNQVAEFNEEERFVTMLGFQWLGEPSSEGLRQFIYAKDDKPLLRKKDLKSNGLKKIYKSHTPKEMIAIPSLTMAKKYSYNFDDFNEDFERVVEIYNAWGSSELAEKKGNVRPIKLNGKKASIETEEGSLQKALCRGFRFGFVAGGIDKRGLYENFSENAQVEYSPGLTAVLTPDYSRDSIFQALFNRKCYATTGARILIEFKIAGQTMGSSISTLNKPGLAFNRHISGFIAGTAPIKTISLFRNGQLLKTLENLPDFHEFAIDDDAPIETVLLKDEREKKPFTFYYMRVEQADGHIAWTSPIWIDYVQEEKKKGRKKV